MRRRSCIRRTGRSGRRGGSSGAGLNKKRRGVLRGVSEQAKAVVLLSGGLDSATVLAMAREQGFACYALSFRYGQRHAVELQAAERVARALGAVEHRVAELDLRVFGGSALTSEMAVPKHEAVEEIGGGIPVT